MIRIKGRRERETEKERKQVVEWHSLSNFYLTAFPLELTNKPSQPILLPFNLSEIAGNDNSNAG